MNSHALVIGGFSPFTIGHHEVVKSAQEGEHDSVNVFTTHSTKRPISAEEKVKYIKLAAGKGVNVDAAQGPFHAASNIYASGKRGKLVVYGGSDRKHFAKMLEGQNGVKDKPHGYYKFDKIEFRQVGKEREEGAKGVAGVSGSLARKSKNAKELKKYLPTALHPHAEDIFKQLKENFMSSKALFLLGGPGSGKDYVINNILTHFNLVEVQMDQILNGSVSHLIESGTNLMINTPVDMEKIALVRATLGEGYDTSFALVSVTNRVSRERNELRARPMNESVRIRKWLDAEQSTEVFENVFKFENSLNLSEASQRELTGFQMQIEAFLKFMIENGYVFEKKVPEPTGDLKKACWKGYTAVGMKMKNGRKVPNCVPVKESEQVDEGAYTSAQQFKRRAAMSAAYDRIGDPRRAEKQDKIAQRHYNAAVEKDGGQSPNNDPLGQSWSYTGKKLKEGFTPDSEKIAHHLIVKHNGNVKPKHLDDYQDSLDTSKPIDREEVMSHVKSKMKRLTPIRGITGNPGWKASNPVTRRRNFFNNIEDALKFAHRQPNPRKTNEQLEYGTDETRATYQAQTPGQAVVDFTPELKPKRKKAKTNPADNFDARFPGGSSVFGLTQSGVAAYESVSLEEAVQYHLENKIPFAENIFRPGSDMFFELIREAKNLYANGEYTPADEYEQDMLESDLGETAMYEGVEVLLDFPFLEEEATPKHVRKLSKYEDDEGGAVELVDTNIDMIKKNTLQKKKEEPCCDDCDDLNEEEGSSDPTKGKGIGKPWREGGGGAVYVRTGDGGVKKVRFSQSGMAKKFRNPARLKSFMARHNCLGNKDKTSASYWACRYPRFFSNTGQLWW